MYGKVLFLLFIKSVFSVRVQLLLPKTIKNRNENYLYNASHTTVPFIQWDLR